MGPATLRRAAAVARAALRGVPRLPAGVPGPAVGRSLPCRASRHALTVSTTQGKLRRTSMNKLTTQRPTVLEAERFDAAVLRELLGGRAAAVRVPGLVTEEEGRRVAAGLARLA